MSNFFRKIFFYSRFLFAQVVMILKSSLNPNTALIYLRSVRKAATVFKSPRSHWWSNFVHDLITVDFSQTDIYTGVRIATLVVAIIVLGLITNHVAEASLVFLGAAYVLAIDEIRFKWPRTRLLLTVSILYASIFAIGMIISASDFLVVPLFSPWIVYHIIP